MEDPDNGLDGKTFLDNLNPQSLEILSNAQAEPGLRGSARAPSVQFERLGYFCVDRIRPKRASCSTRTVSLKDTWARLSQKS